MKPILFFTLLCVPALAAPSPEPLAPENLVSTIRTWFRTAPAGEASRTLGDEPYVSREKLVILWERTQTVQPGDMFVADYPKQELEFAVRIAGRVTATTVTTKSGTTIPLAQVRGVVRRVLRVE